ncbi:MAG: hypothetical protein ACXWZU_10105 [Actinomycetota bacterium]
MSRRLLKVAAWGAVFLACAGVGAMIAARTDPFPPGVDDPGIRPTRSTGSDAPGVMTWPAVVASRTWHDLPVGGRCATSWRIELDLVVGDAGDVTVEGAARLNGGLRCDFPTAQLQSEELTIVGAGRLRGQEFVFTIQEAGRKPPGSKDYGGLTNTLNFLRFRVPAEDGASVTVRLSRPADAGRGEYGSVNRLTLSGPTTG